jgi:uncharacterized protein (DUF1684 family)
MTNKFGFLLVFSLLLSVACNKPKPSSFDAAGYRTEIAKWQNGR